MRKKQAASITEYIVLIVMFLAAMLVMQKYITRTFFDRWKQAGDTFGYGEQYDPNSTLECGRYVDPSNNYEVWYVVNPGHLYEHCVDGTPPHPTCHVLTGAARINCCAYAYESGLCNF